jgi:hypothetical protein
MGGEVLPRPGSKDAQISREKPTVSKGFKGLAQIMEPEKRGTKENLSLQQDQKEKARQFNLNNLKNLSVDK